MPPERQPTTPDWDHYEREADREWIAENLDLFRTTVTAAFQEMDRGAIVVDITTRSDQGAGHPLSYFPQAQVEAYDDEDTNRMLSEYDPEHELVIVLLKPEGRTCTYCVRTTPPEPEPEPALEVPDIETLIAWEAEGGCEAACPYGCWVEPDGTCPHGKPSWLIVMGLI